ncbi:MAG: ribbon-helix-helix domain-containing protein [Candidatus Bathyarchaeota archaeon]|nr:ribbon-helix-helix domain-containing protein [Candidatus Bathyarchaeota archaeon]
MSNSNLNLLQIKIPIEWKQPLEDKARQKGYVTTAEAVRVLIRDFLAEP